MGKEPITSQPKPKPKKRLATFNVDEATRFLLLAGMNRDGYAANRKSRWLCKAVQAFAIAEPHFASVGSGEAALSFIGVEHILMDEATEEVFDDAIRCIRMFDHRAGGLKAPILRAAIRHAAGPELMAAYANHQANTTGFPKAGKETRANQDDESKGTWMRTLIHGPRKRLTLFRLDAELKQALTKALEREGVGERGKSRWLCSAIRTYLEIDSPRFDRAGAGEGLKQFALKERIMLDAATDEAIDKAIRLLRVTDYRLERLQAKLIRAAIRYASGDETEEAPRQASEPSARKPGRRLGGMRTIHETAKTN